MCFCAWAWYVAQQLGVQCTSDAVSAYTKCPVYWRIFEISTNSALEKKTFPPRGCRAPKLSDFLPLLHSLLEDVSLCTGCVGPSFFACMVCMHASAYKQWAEYTRTPDFICVKSSPRKSEKTVYFFHIFCSISCRDGG